MEEIKKEILNINTKVDRMYDAIMGSKITNDGGMVARLMKVETRQDLVEKDFEEWMEEIEKEITAIKVRNAKYDTAQKVMWICLGGAIVMMVNYILGLILK